MRYSKGSLSLNRMQDKFILQFVADSRYIARSQLFEFVRLEYGEFSAVPCSIGESRRMVECGLLRKQDPPILGGDTLYSVKRAGIQALERLGIYYLGANLEREQDGEGFLIPHALEVNAIHLAMMRTLVLKQWIPESLIRVLNLSPYYAYAKVYDGIASLSVAGRRIDVAVEYERTLKSQTKYQKIREAIESEKRTEAVLYLAPTEELLDSLRNEFWQTSKCVLFGLLDNFKRDRIGTIVYESNYNRLSLLQALTKVIPAKTET
jgi:hypothetical protein